MKKYKYSNNALKKLADESYFDNQVCKSTKLKDKIFDKYNVPRQKSYKDEEDYLYHEVVPFELVCEMSDTINDLAYIILNERKEAIELLEESKRDLTNLISKFKNK